MPSDRARDALLDIRENILLAQGFLGNLTPEGFAADTRTRYAVMRCLEIISEASRRVAADIRDRHPGIPWSRIAAAGNVYRHEYKSIRDDLVLDTVHRALPRLLEAVEVELSRLA
ncbi:HepT-like ribonuclease domain-containing protein [Paracraurococcus lichenis]|uniref:DUF86 domain-containing protein n=1 Tax=Paracraurococcus lichenis TaxID=3064888 RepID=A0ABT9DV47_9PROT|nr:HepT-like ribonuclease domain-containing protein [Paracraurococcus sp. LOR1-02]MDO9707776.1 DUF86 domain-containing protein [Paracraurococcus sp. LOR1-02]